jgi:guanylate kinase
MEDTKPKLQNPQAFRNALANYEVSEHARRVLASTDFVVVSGIAGGGRNTVIKELEKTGDYIFAVSDTTRSPKLRNGKMEQHGVEYYFRAEAEMLADIQQGEFIEAELIHNQQVSGTSIRELERVAATGKIPIHDFEYGGANNVAHAKPDAYVIGLLPPSYEEWLRRFRDREEIHHEEFLNRLETARKVLNNMLTKPYFKIVINKDVSECALQIRDIVEHGSYDANSHAKGVAIARELLQQVTAHLESRG